MHIPRLTRVARTHPPKARLAEQSSSTAVASRRRCALARRSCVVLLGVAKLRDCLSAAETRNPPFPTPAQARALSKTAGVASRGYRGPDDDAECGGAVDLRRFGQRVAVGDQRLDIKGERLFGVDDRLFVTVAPSLTAGKIRKMREVAAVRGLMLDPQGVG